MFKTLKNYILLRLGITQTNHYLKQINNRVDFLAAYINLTVTENLHFDPVLLKNAIAELKKSYQVEDFNSTVHKNDLMFASHLYHHRYDLQHAIFTYFRIGIRTAQNLHKIASSHGITPQHILDFGSGYGRVSRFLPQVFSKSRLTISEVKGCSLKFQSQYFGFEGIEHTQDPESFDHSPFDLIFALSVFTHLPRSSFEAWLKKLLHSLITGGALVFTFNNISTSSYAETADPDFHYLLLSEDSSFSFISDSLSDTSEYGSTYVSYGFLENLLSEEDVDFHFLKNDLALNQEAILIIKK